MMTIVPCDSYAGDLELGASRFMHGDLFALGRSMIPLEISGFVIGVYVELSGQRKMGVGDFVVLMSLNVLKCRWNLEILESCVDLFQDIPIQCEGGGGVVGRVLTALNDAREKALIRRERRGCPGWSKGVNL
jgi:hypothetical protein